MTRISWSIIAENVAMRTNCWPLKMCVLQKHKSRKPNRHSITSLTNTQNWIRHCPESTRSCVPMRTARQTRPSRQSLVRSFTYVMMIWIWDTCTYVPLVTRYGRHARIHRLLLLDKNKKIKTVVKNSCKNFFFIKENWVNRFKVIFS